MHDINHRLLALQRALEVAVDDDEAERLTEEIDRIHAERRSTARAIPEFATRA